MNENQNKIDPELAEKIIRVSIAILTALLGFFTGMGSANACQVFHFIN